MPAEKRSASAKSRRTSPSPAASMPRQSTALKRFVAPLGFASPRTRTSFLQRLSGLVLAIAFPAGLAGAWFWSIVHEPDLPLPFRVAVDHAAIEPSNRRERPDLTPLQIPLQDQAPVAGLSRDPRLIEHSIHGAVPRISADGLKPRHVYARPFQDTTNRPRIAVIVTGLGLGLALTDRALATLPPAIALAFSPYAQDLVRHVQAARQDNRELLLQIPMEPYDFPANDAGPAMLVADLEADANQDRLLWSLARMNGYVGLINWQGGRFRDSPAMTRFVEQAERRGLFYIDDGVGRTKTGGFKHAHLVIDPLQSEASFTALENVARSKGGAIGVVVVTPTMIDRLAAWAAQLEGKGLMLAPLTAVIDHHR